MYTHTCFVELYVIKSAGGVDGQPWRPRKGAPGGGQPARAPYQHRASCAPVCPALLVARASARRPAAVARHASGLPAPITSLGSRLTPYTHSCTNR
jgi:hypothetical protein